MFECEEVVQHQVQVFQRECSLEKAVWQFTFAVADFGQLIRFLIANNSCAGSR